jgi:Spy/CpxP family protein refolding chaperone
MTRTSRTALLFSTALALGASNQSASAQPYGPGQGGMMGGGEGWGMGWGMGGFGGVGLLVVTLLVVGFVFLAVRRRNS